MKMRKSLSVIVLLTVLLLLVSCSSSEKKISPEEADLPPEPGAPGTATGAGGDLVGQAYKGQRVEGYAPPIDAYGSDEPQVAFITPEVINRELEDLDEFLRVKPESTTVKVDFQGGLVYKKVGYYDPRKKEWLMSDFPQKAVGSSNWIRNFAELKLTFPDMVDGINYFVVYFCKRYEGVWRCGYDYRGGKGGMWSLLTVVKRSVLFPPEPVPVGKVITQRAWLSPSFDLFKEGAPVWINAHLESQNKDLDDETVTVNVLREGTNELVSSVDVKAVDSMLCPDGLKGGPGFHCDRTYAGQLGSAPLGDGDYVLSLDDAPASMQLQNGGFRTISDARLNTLIITNNIVGYDYYGPFWGWYGDEFEQYSAWYYSDQQASANVIHDLTPDKHVVSNAAAKLAGSGYTIVDVVDADGKPHKVYTLVPDYGSLTGEVVGITGADVVVDYEEENQLEAVDDEESELDEDGDGFCDDCDTDEDGVIDDSCLATSEEDIDNDEVGDDGCGPNQTPDDDADGSDDTGDDVEEEDEENEEEVDDGNDTLEKEDEDEGYSNYTYYTYAWPSADGSRFVTITYYYNHNNNNDVVAAYLSKIPSGLS